MCKENIYLINKNKGFTLVQIIVVMIILSIFFIFAKVNFSNNLTESVIITNTTETELARLLLDDVITDLGFDKVIEKQIITQNYESISNDVTIYNSEELVKDDNDINYILNTINKKQEAYLLDNNYFFDNMDKSSEKFFFIKNNNKNNLFKIIEH